MSRVGLVSPEEEIRRARSILRAALEASGGGPLDADEALVTMAERAALHLDGWMDVAERWAAVIAQIRASSRPLEPALGAIASP